MSKHHLFADTTGLSGFVYSSLLCNCLTLIVLYFHSRYYHRFQELIDFFNQKLSKADLIEVLRLGGPMVFQQMIEMGAIVSSSLMLGMINVKALVARHIANQYTMNLAVPVFGFADASSLLVSQQIGRGRMINAYKLTMATMSLATMIPLFLLGVTYTLNPDSLMLLFKTKNMNAHIGHSVLTFMRIQLVVLVLDGMCYPLVSVLRSYRDTFVPCLWSFLSLALMGPAFGYVMGVKQQIPEWVLWGEAVGVFVGLAYLLPRWRRTSIRHLQPTSIKIEHLKAARFACLCGSMVYPERAYADPRQTPQQQNGHDARFEQQGLLSDVDA